jgi:hypothetical protein
VSNSPELPSQPPAADNIARAADSEQCARGRVKDSEPDKINDVQTTSMPGEMAGPGLEDVAAKGLVKSEECPICGRCRLEPE